MRKSTMLLLAALTAGVGSALWLKYQLSAERDANAALRQQLAAFAERRESVVRPSIPAVALSPKAASPALATKIDSGMRPQNSPPAQTDFAAQQRLLLKSPAYRQAVREQRRLYMEEVYGELGKVLNLTLEQQAAVLDMLTDQSMDLMDLQWQQPANKEETAAIRRLIEQKERAADVQLERLLGSSSLNRLKDFQQTIGSRTEMNRLRGELAMGSEALRDDQYEPMLGIVAAEQSRMSREIQDAFASEPVPNPDPDFSRRTELMVAANKRIVESARSILTPTQLATIETFYRRQRLQMESMDRMTKAQFDEERQRRESGN